MTADFNKPIAEDQFLDVLTEIRDNLSALAKQDLSDAQNVPEGAIQYSEANHRWEKRLNAVWTALSPLTQALDVKVHDSERLGDKEPAYYRNADNINAGTLDNSRLDTEATDYNSASETKLAHISAVRTLYNWIRIQLSTHRHTAQQITSGVFAQSRIPNLPANRINSGVFAQSRIPNLPANRINSGILDEDRIPFLEGSKIKGGSINHYFLPARVKTPVGTIVISANPAPHSFTWLVCNGASLNRSVYPLLFMKIGRTYGGAGEYFNLPELSNQFLRVFHGGQELRMKYIIKAEE